MSVLTLVQRKFRHPSLQLDLGLPSEPITKVAPAVLKAEPTLRVLQLAQHRPWTTPAEYEPPNSHESVSHAMPLADRFSRHFTVSPAALHSRPSERVTELATPRVRKDAIMAPREHAFTVSPAALSARASGRILELAEPIKREV